MTFLVTTENRLTKEINSLRKLKTLSKEYIKIIEDYMNNQKDKRPTENKYEKIS